MSLSTSCILRCLTLALLKSEHYIGSILVRMYQDATGSRLGSRISRNDRLNRTAGLFVDQSH